MATAICLQWHNAAVLHRAGHDFRQSVGSRAGNWLACSCDLGGGWQDIDGNNSACSLDAQGRKVAQRNAAGSQTASTFDTANNVLSTQLPSGNTMQSIWDSQGNELTHTDPLGHQVDSMRFAHL